MRLSVKRQGILSSLLLCSLLAKNVACFFACAPMDAALSKLVTTVLASSREEGGLFLYPSIAAVYGVLSTAAAALLLFFSVVFFCKRKTVAPAIVNSLIVVFNIVGSTDRWHREVCRSVHEAVLRGVVSRDNERHTPFVLFLSHFYRNLPKAIAAILSEEILFFLIVFLLLVLVQLIFPGLVSAFVFSSFIMKLFAFPFVRLHKDTSHVQDVLKIDEYRNSDSHTFYSLDVVSMVSLVAENIAHSFRERASLAVSVLVLVVLLPLLFMSFLSRISLLRNRVPALLFVVLCVEIVVSVSMRNFFSRGVMMGNSLSREDRKRIGMISDTIGHEYFVANSLGITELDNRKCSMERFLAQDWKKKEELLSGKSEQEIVACRYYEFVLRMVLILEKMTSGILRFAGLFIIKDTDREKIMLSRRSHSVFFDVACIMLSSGSADPSYNIVFEDNVAEIPDEAERKKAYYFSSVARFWRYEHPEGAKRSLRVPAFYGLLLKAFYGTYDSYGNDDGVHKDRKVHRLVMMLLLDLWVRWISGIVTLWSFLGLFVLLHFIGKRKREEQRLAHRWQRRNRSDRVDPYVSGWKNPVGEGHAWTVTISPNAKASVEETNVEEQLL